jgi:ribA/ribD-fused uncharacterized protein
MIISFKNKYEFLSNFYNSPVSLDGVTYYDSVEHAYQAQKTLDPQKQKQIRLALTPGIAKKFGRAVELRKDWDQVRLSIMQQLLHEKFKTKVMRQKLLSTGYQHLEEGNHWHDTFFGVCNGFCNADPLHEPYGLNYLGKLLMELREEFRASEEQSIRERIAI